MAKKLMEDNARQASLDEKQFRLLLVDEEVDDLDYYAGVLRYLGYEVRKVGSYAQAADLLGHERFDLVMVDQGSKSFEGRSVLSRAVEADGHVPVLVLTRTVDADCCIEALDSGAYEYVQKPLTTSEVRELVSDYLKSRLTTDSAARHYPSQQAALDSLLSAP